MSRFTTFTAVIALVSFALSPPPSGSAEEDAGRPDAEQLGFVTGKSWGSSSRGERTAYLIGIGNLLSVENAFQQLSGNRPTDQQTLIRATWDAVGPKTTNQVYRIVDDWYAANPDQQHKPVLDVIWDQIVEPMLRSEGKTGRK